VNRAALIVNRAEVKPAEIEALYRITAAACVDAGWPAPALLLSDEQDPGCGQAGQALRDGADLVVACGGDGTVNAVAGALADTGAALGIVPFGAGSLLAADLGVPDDLEKAVSALITGVDRRIDLGRVGGGPDGRAPERPGGRALVGLAGLGLAASMVGDVPARLRKRLPRPAYLMAVARHLGDRGVTVTFELDGRVVRHRCVRTALIGNFGRVQGGLDLIPGAEPDDGLLDLVVLTPRGRVAGWPRALSELLSSRARNTDDVTRYRAGHIVARTRRPIAQEVDGEFLGHGVCLDVQVRRRALAVRVPRTEAVPEFPDPQDSCRADRIGEQMSLAAEAERR
jgi:diacylglycerol kinase (ATP)